MYFNTATIVSSLSLPLSAIHAVPHGIAPHSTSTISSAASTSSPACPPHSASEHEQRENFNAFVKDFYFNQQVAEAFDDYVWVDFIQHNPTVGQGRDAAVTALEGLFAAEKALAFI